MVGIIGKKIGMTRIFNDKGQCIPCTIILSEPAYVSQIKTKDKDGYNSIQLASGDKKLKNSNKAEIGHFKLSNLNPKRKIVEFKNFLENYDKNLEIGQKISLEEIFEEGEFIDVQGISKGKGFQGVVKRHGFSGVGDRTHGQHNRQRAPGSIGGASYPSRVFKGMKMAGRTGNKKVTVQNLKILKIIPDANTLVINGCVPGPKNGFLVIHK